MINDDRLTQELIEICGDGGFLRLTEIYGGTRLFIPARPDASSVQNDLGVDIANRLAKRYGGAYLRVPLAREWRAMHYRSMGASNARVARALGMTETGVEKLFARTARPTVKGDNRQLSLFSHHSFETTKPTPPRRA